MSNLTCEKALQLAEQKKLSGDVLAARWHVTHCQQCQHMLNEIWTQIVIFDDQLVLQEFLGIDLGEAICQRRDRFITWLERNTKQVLAVLVHLSESTSPLMAAPRLTTLGGAEESERRVIHQNMEQTPDGSVEWKIIFVVDSVDPEHCAAEVQVNVFDRWKLAGIDVFLTWNDQQRRRQTDDKGQVSFKRVPVDALGKVNVIIHPPQEPMNTKGAQ